MPGVSKNVTWGSWVGQSRLLRPLLSGKEQSLLSQTHSEGWGGLSQMWESSSRSWSSFPCWVIRVCYPRPGKVQGQLTWGVGEQVTLDQWGVGPFQQGPVLAHTFQHMICLGHYSNMGNRDPHKFKLLQDHGPRHGHLQQLRDRCLMALGGCTGLSDMNGPKSRMAPGLQSGPMWRI